MNEHEIDRTLTDAGTRLRADAPDAIATQQALRTARERRPAPSAPKRNWWPTAIGIGLAGAAVLGVIAYNAGGADDTVELVPAGPSTVPGSEVPVTTLDPAIVEPVIPDETLVPMTTLAPEAPAPTADVTVITTDGGQCIELRFLTESAVTVGCAEQLAPERSWFAASGNRSYALNEEPRQADGSRVITAREIDAGELGFCGLRAEDVIGRIVFGVNCTSGLDGPVALAARLPVEPDGPTTYFTTPYSFTPDGIDFGAPVFAQDDLIVLIGTESSTTPTIRCVDIVSTSSGEWRETCGPGDAPWPSGLISVIDDTMIQVDLDPAGNVTVNALDDRVPPGSGCTYDAAKQLMRTPTLITSELRCAGDQASIGAGSVLFQPGPPDGTIERYELVDGAWVLRNSGTGIDDVVPYRTPTYATWSAWPGDTAPYQPPFIAPADPSTPTLDIGATLTDPAPSVDALAAAIVEHIDGLAPDPEFPANTRLLAVEPEGLPLIVAQADVGGDDSIRGEVVYVWFEPVFDQETITGYRIETTYVTQLCWRGASPDSPLCV